MFRSRQTIIRELCSLLKLCYSIHNSIRICERGVVAAYHVVEQWLGVLRMLSNERLVITSLSLLSIRRTPSHCSTTHSYTTWYAATTPRLQIPIELWILQHNFSKEQSSLMMVWQDRNMSECFKVFYVKLYVHSLVDKLKRKLTFYLFAYYVIKI